MKKTILSFVSLIIASTSITGFAQNKSGSNVKTNATPPKAVIAPQNKVEEFIQKNDNVLFYMEEAIKQQIVNYDDYLSVFKRWQEIKSVLAAFNKNPERYKKEYVYEIKEQEELFAEYSRSIYSILVNESATKNDLKFRFSVDGTNLTIMVPTLTESVADEFKRSNYLNPTGEKYKELVKLGFKDISITDGKRNIDLLTIK